MFTRERSLDSPALSNDRHDGPDREGDREEDENATDDLIAAFQSRDPDGEKDSEDGETDCVFRTGVMQQGLLSD